MNLMSWILRKSKKELAIVFIILTILIMLPAISLIVLVASGESVISNAIAVINPVTHFVDIFDANGKKVNELELSTTWPTTGYISDEFGTQDAFRSEMGFGPHTGIDIANEHGDIGSPITTFMIGTVQKVHDIDDNICGKYVKIDNGAGITSLYCHLSVTATTEKLVVNPGDVIGYMGKSGAATGSHLHFQINVFDIPVNPRNFMVGEPKGTY
jgi:murein DD-endopeptidase MepM/ murein hydrolase activator NlpD